jgi:hypothetical protein
MTALGYVVPVYLTEYDGTNSSEILALFPTDIVGINSGVIELPYILSETGGVLTIRYDETGDNHLPTDTEIPEGALVPNGVAPQTGASWTMASDIGTKLIPLSDIVN